MLLDETEITFITHISKDYYDEGGVLVRGRTENNKATGSLQPVRDSLKRMVTPQGTLPDGAYNFYTQDDVGFLNQATKISSPTCFIDGLEYVVQIAGDWTRTKLTTRHTHVRLFLKEQGRS